ncbi:MAG: glycosyltransferase family 2 protein [Lachnospiraceae bacterium]|nr:glycosyltransferase family 2 protein [Lachnospiraceae bacterium]
MKEKLLTISIAAYNVEQYIEQCLQSIVACKYIDDIEVFVIDDGGTDKTAEVAEKYSSMFQNSINIVRKSNGGYGSTVNYSILHARGKYFKLLDGDDWFNTNGLEELIKQLKNNDYDMVLSNVLKGPSEDNLSLIDYVGENIDSCKSGELSSIVGHWGITFKTNILRKSKLNLPEHCLYTDKLYSTIPFFYVKTIGLCNNSVYCYRTGRDGQSISRDSRINHFSEYIKVCKLLFKFVENSDCMEKSYVFRRVINGYHLAIKTLLLLKICAKNRKLIIKFEKKCKEETPRVYYAASEANTKTGKILKWLRKSKYCLYYAFALVPKSRIDF